MAVGDERAHAEIGGEYYRLAVVGFGLLSVRSISVRSVAEEMECPRLVPAFGGLPGERQGSPGQPKCVNEPVREDAGLTWSIHLCIDPGPRRRGPQSRPTLSRFPPLIPRESRPFSGIPDHSSSGLALRRRLVVLRLTFASMRRSFEARVGRVAMRGRGTNIARRTSSAKAVARVLPVLLLRPEALGADDQHAVPRQPPAGKPH
jgi:hypothetical protein